MCRSWLLSLNNKRLFMTLLAPLFILAALLTACGSQEAAPGSYLSTSSTNVLFLQWVNNNGQLSGQLQEVYTTSDNPLHVQQNNEAFTGVLNGSQLSLSISLFGVTKTITGTFDGSTLKLVVPNQNGQLDTIILHPATVDDYNKAAASFEANIQERANQATATAQAQVTPAQSNNQVYISDQAKVLNVNQVQSEASYLPDPISIYTVNTFTGTSTDFDQRARSHITSPSMIVIAIDTLHHHLAIIGGSNVPLSSSQYQDAVQAFKSNFNNGDYSGATIATIRSLRSMLGAAST